MKKTGKTINRPKTVKTHSVCADCTQEVCPVEFWRDFMASEMPCAFKDEYIDKQPKEAVA